MSPENPILAGENPSSPARFPPFGGQRAYLSLARKFHREVSAEQPKGALIQVLKAKLEEFRRCQSVPLIRCCLGALGAR